MAKYSFEFKKNIVLEYLSGKGGSEFLAKKYGVPQGKMVRRWIEYYQEFGEEGLRRSRKKETYSFEFKLHMVELYLSSEVSYQELAFSQGITNSTLITKWVNDFRVAGSDALRSRKKGRKKTLNTPAKKKEEIKVGKTSTVDTSAEHVKELEEELLKLRIENAYLKEGRRLRLEEEALLKKQRESSTASEEHSN